MIDLDKKTSIDLKASVESCVHREIYRTTKKEFILHAHTPFAVALSLVHKEKIVPLDSEGKLFLKDIPIITGESGTEYLGNKLGFCMLKRNTVINKGHGIFSCAESIKEAFINIAMAEHAAKIIFLKTVYGKLLKLQ